MGYTSAAVLCAFFRKEWMGTTMSSADSQGTVFLALSKEEAALLIETAQPILEGFSLWHSVDPGSCPTETLELIGVLVERLKSGIENQQGNYCH